MDLFYNGSKLLSLMDLDGERPTFYMAMTNRSGGKSTWFYRLVMKRFLLHNKKFALLYRFKNELCGISAKFFKDYPSAMKLEGSKLIVFKDGYTLAQKVRQPQGAMVICDNNNGEIKAMVGGRGTSGKRLYNRALSTRQPGSSIKPLSVYSMALSDGESASAKDKPQKFKKYDKNDDIYKYGNYWTAASVINDAPHVINGKV